MKNCLNCQTSISEEAKFCSNCGQKNTDGKVSVAEFIHIFFDTYFNIDSSIFRTAAGLFVPGRLTKQFFKGRRKSFLHPLRIFLLTAAFFIAVLGFQINGYLSSKADDMSKQVHGYMIKTQVLNEIDSIQKSLIGSNSCIDTSFADSLRMIYDTNILDSLEGKINVTFSGIERSLTFADFYTESVPNLAEKHKITDWKELLLMTQIKRFMNAPNKYIQTIIGNLIWMILLLMPAIALMLKLYYHRQGTYFVEHLVFSFHFNAFAFLFVGFTTWIFDSNPRMLIISNLLTAIFLFFAMKQFYQQSIGKTFLKWILVLFAYFIIIILLTTILLGISFVMF